MAWEARQQETSVLIGIPHIGQVSTQWALNFALLERPAGTVHNFARGTPWDIARQQLAEAALKSSAKYLLFWDSDNLVPPDALRRLMSHNLPIVSALYYRRHEPVTPAMWNLVPPEPKCSTCGQPVKAKGKYVPITNWPEGNPLVECDVIGLGFCLISRRVLERLDEKFPNEPWFLWTQGRRGIKEEDYLSEDFYFMERCAEVGFKPIVDTGVLSKHIGDVVFGEGGKIVKPEV